MQPVNIWVRKKQKLNEFKDLLVNIDYNTVKCKAEESISIAALTPFKIGSKFVTNGRNRL